MQGKRWISVLLVILSLGVNCFPVQGAPGPVHSQLNLSNPFNPAQSPSSREWWGVLYDNALLLARMDDGENDESEMEESTETVEFVWPLLGWLFALLSPASAQ